MRTASLLLRPLEKQGVKISTELLETGALSFINLLLFAQFFALSVCLVFGPNAYGDGFFVGVLSEYGLSARAA